MCGLMRPRPLKAGKINRKRVFTPSNVCNLCSGADTLEKCCEVVYCVIKNFDHDHDHAKERVFNHEHDHEIYFNQNHDHVHGFYFNLYHDHDHEY